MKRIILFFSFLLFLCTLRSLANSLSESLPTRRGLVTDLPFETRENQFSFQIWFTGDSEDRDNLTVFLYNNPNLTFNRTQISLHRSKPETITVTRKKHSSASLVEIIARPQLQGWDGINQTVNFGFKASLRTDLPDTLKGGEKRAFSVEIVDSDGKPVTLTAPAFMRLIGSNAKIRQGADWVSKLDIPLQTGANATPLIEIVAEKVPWGGRGSLQAELHAAEQYVLTNSGARSFNIPVATWMQYCMAVVGGLINVGYSLLLIVAEIKKNGKQTFNKNRAWAQAGIGVVGGVLAVLFADKLSLVGIRVDQVTVAGYVVMGFVISYIGIGAVLGKLKLVEAPTVGEGNESGSKTQEEGKSLQEPLNKQPAAKATAKTA